MSESISILKELLRLNTENPPGNTSKIIKWIKKWAEMNKIPFKTHWYKENQGNIVLTVGNAPSSIVICGHLDTVPIGERKKWDFDPLGDETENFIYGRGSADMKGGIASSLGALKQLNDTLDLNDIDYNVTFLGTSDEERGLAGAKAAINCGIMDNVDFLIIPEPTSTRVGLAEKGVLWYLIHSFGRSAHGSTPEKGINAIEELVSLFPHLKQAVPTISHPILGQSTLNIGMIKGGKSCNVVPEKAEIHCDFRLVPPIDPSDFAAKLSLRIKEFTENVPGRFETEVRQIMPPVSNSSENRFIQVFMDESNNTIPIGLNYGTDAAVLIPKAATKVPFVIYGPGDPKAIHCTNEKVAKAELLEVESVLFNFLKRVTTH
ncbi:MAG: M20 family metallopeptidase [Candidatus Hodarchaeales archaeon]|jgi:succinyl-diaminopimelate desuccinylase